MSDLCASCNGTGWVCEFCGTQWELAAGGTCCSCGVPCGCNPTEEFEFEAVFAAVDETLVTHKIH